MRYALIYGCIAGAVVVSIISTTIALDLPGHATSMWVGYLVMLAGLSLIFVGVKRFRDFDCGGVIRFGRAFWLGLGIAAVAGVIYVIGWEIYLSASGHDFMADLGARSLAEMRADGAAQTAIDAQAVKMEALAESYRDPLFRVPITFIEIFPVGVLVALVSAAALRNPAVLPVRVR